MRRLLVGVGLVSVLAACEPGEPDAEYATLSLTPGITEIHTATIGTDGGVYGVRPTGPLGSRTVVARLTVDGAIDGRWGRAVEGFEQRAVPAGDGSAYVLTASIAEPGLMLAAMVRADGTVAWDDVRLGLGQLGDARVVDGRLRVVLFDFTVADGVTRALEVASERTVRELAVIPATPTTSVVAHRWASDGSLVALTAVWNAGGTDRELHLRRYLPSGERDAGFGVGGDVTMHDQRSCNGVGDDYLVLVEARPGTGPWLATFCGSRSELFRLDAGGRRDLAWSDGALTADEVPGPGWVTAWYPAPDGSVLVERTCGGADQGCDPDALPVLVRFGADGSLDRDWGSDGIAHPLVRPIAVVHTATGVMIEGSAEDGSPRFHRLVGPEPT